MSSSHRLNLPYLMPGQAQKHVTYNEALRRLDALVQISVVSRSTAMPPSTRSPGEAHIVSKNGVGDWSSRAHQIASWQDGAWTYFVPQTGWLVYAEDSEGLLVFTGTEWIDVLGQSFANLANLGINAQADESNRLTIAAPATLLTHEGSDHYLKINKNSAEDFASVLLQTAYSGRAEFGLTGSDDFEVKVSSDGENWTSALSINNQTGVVTLPATPGRKVTMSDINIYVRPDGDISNTGLGDSAGEAVNSIQRAVDIVSGLDIGVHSAVIQISAGTYNESIVLKPSAGSGLITLRGNPSAPADVIIESATNCITGPGFIGNYHLEGMKLRTTKSCLLMDRGASCTFNQIHFDGTGTHIYARAGGTVELTPYGAYAITATSFAVHAHANLPGSSIPLYGATIAFPSLPTQVTSDFVKSRRCAAVNLGSLTLTNVANVSGRRFACSENAILITGGQPSQVPGNLDGVAIDGGVVT